MPRLGKAVVTRKRADLARVGTSMQRDWDNAATADIHGCNVQPATAKEFETDREYAESVLHVWAPAGTDILASDRAEFDGAEYDVSTDGQPWANINSRPHHVAFDMIIRRG